MAEINCINEEEAPCVYCEGSGIVLDARIESTCCGNVNNYGSCCGYPDPVQVAYPKQCEGCQCVGELHKTLSINK